MTDPIEEIVQADDRFGTDDRGPDDTLALDKGFLAVILADWRIEKALHELAGAKEEIERLRKLLKDALKTDA